MSRKSLIKSIQETNDAITLHQRQIHAANEAISQAITPPTPYVYALPIVAFLLGLRYSKVCSKVVSLKQMYTYGMLLLPLFKD